MQANLTLKITLLFITVLSAHKIYTKDYWLFYSKYLKGEGLILILLQFLWYWTMKSTFSDIVYWTMMMIVHLIFIFPICHLSSWVSKCLNQLFVVISITIVLKQSNTYKSSFSNFYLYHHWKVHNDCFISEATTKHCINIGGQPIMVV